MAPQRAVALPLDQLRQARAEAKGLAFRVHSGPEADGWVLSDAVRIKQILSNLVSNAIKFTAAGQLEVTIDLHDLDADGRAELRLGVHDSGIGFDEGLSDQLFQRFSQADGSITRRFGGTGLGPSICQALVELMGGDIALTSQPVVGSRFWVGIPLGRHEPNHGPHDP